MGASKNIGKGISRFVAYFNTPEGEKIMLDLKSGGTTYAQYSFKRSSEHDEFYYFKVATLQPLINQAAQKTNDRFTIRVVFEGTNHLYAYYSSVRGWLTPSEYDALQCEREKAMALRDATAVTYRWFVPACSETHKDKAVGYFTKRCTNADDALRDAYEQSAKAYLQGTYLLNKFYFYQNGVKKELGVFSLDTFASEYPHLFVGK